MLYYCFSRVQPVAAWFLQFCWFATHIHAAVDSLNLAINWLQLGPVGAIAQEKWSLRFCAAAAELCCAHHALVHAWADCWVAERQIILSLTTCLITANICWDSKISYQSCLLTFHFRLDKNNSHFWHMQRPKSWRIFKSDECVVTDGSMLYFLPRSLPERLTHLTDCNFIIRYTYVILSSLLTVFNACMFYCITLRSDSCQIHLYVMLCYVVWCIRPILVRMNFEGWFSCNQLIIWMFPVFW